MTNEKSIEELKAELESLRKMNLEKEMSVEREKLELAKKAEEHKKEELLRESIRAELLQEMRGTSTVETPVVKESAIPAPKNMQVFEDMKKKFGLKGISYEQLARLYATGGFKGVR